MTRDYLLLKLASKVFVWKYELDLAANIASVRASWIREEPFVDASLTKEVLALRTTQWLSQYPKTDGASEISFIKSLATHFTIFAHPLLFFP